MPTIDNKTNSFVVLDVERLLLPLTLIIAVCVLCVCVLFVLFAYSRKFNNFLQTEYLPPPPPDL